MGIIYTKLKCIGNKCIGMIYYKPECFRNICFKNIYFKNEYSKLARSLKLLRTVVLQGGVLHVVVVRVALQIRLLGFVVLQIAWRLKMGSGVHLGIPEVRLQEIC
jgi:hypothetical protein